MNHSCYYSCPYVSLVPGMNKKKGILLTLRRENEHPTDSAQGGEYFSRERKVCTQLQYETVAWHRH